MLKRYKYTTHHYNGAISAWCECGAFVYANITADTKVPADSKLLEDTCWMCKKPLFDLEILPIATVLEGWPMTMEKLVATVAELEEPNDVV